MKNLVEQKPVEWSKEDERLLNIIIDILDREEHNGHLTRGDLKACVKLLKSLRPQPKAEWSEEDELMRKRCIADLGYLTEYEPQYKERYDAQIEWLKFLLERFNFQHKQEQPDEQPEYGYLFTEYVCGKKSRWSVGDVLAYYISSSNEEGEYLLGKIVNVELDEEAGWVYTFEDESTCDEESLVEEATYKKN